MTCAELQRGSAHAYPVILAGLLFVAAYVKTYTSTLLLSLAHFLHNFLVVNRLQRSLINSALLQILLGKEHRLIKAMSKWDEFNMSNVHSVTEECKAADAPQNDNNTVSFNKSWTFWALSFCAHDNHYRKGFGRHVMTPPENCITVGTKEIHLLHRTTGIRVFDISLCEIDSIIHLQLW